jgi:rSAM/selenodomain-associated transferase 1
MNNNTLIIIAKYPEKDNVKTRLKGLMTDEKRLDLYVSLLKHTVEKLRSVPGADTFIAYAPAGAEDYFRDFGTRLIALREGDLGEGMFHAFSEVFRLGYRKAALVGADIPGLSAGIIKNSFDVLSDKDIVYGPAEDGGYYLVGMRRLVKEIFQNVPWSSEVTLKKSLEQADRYGYTVGFTQMLSDIDTIEDIKRAGVIF